MFGINQDDDFALLRSAPPEGTSAYESGEGDGPDADDLHIDMMGGLNSEWNKRVLEILLAKLKDVREEEKWSLPNRSDKYLAELIRDRLKKAIRTWVGSQRRTTNSGGLETWDQVEQRLVAQREAQLSATRHATRRRNLR